MEAVSGEIRKNNSFDRCVCVCVYIKPRDDIPNFLRFFIRRFAFLHFVLNDSISARLRVDVDR